MKFIRKLFQLVILLAISGSTICMESRELPKDLWTEIVDKLGINMKENKPEKIFQYMDNLRLTSKAARDGVDAYVKKVGKLKGKDNYTYADLKKDIMKNMIQQTLALRIFITKMDQYEGSKLDKIEEFLKKGANPNLETNPTPKSLYTSPFLRISESEYVDAVKLMLRYGGNPDIGGNDTGYSIIDKSLGSLRFALSNNFFKFNEALDILDIIVNASKKIENHFIKYAQEILKELTDKTSSYFGLYTGIRFGKEDPRVTRLKNILKVMISKAQK